MLVKILPLSAVRVGVNSKSFMSPATMTLRSGFCSCPFLMNALIIVASPIRSASDPRNGGWFLPNNGWSPPLEFKCAPITTTCSPWNSNWAAIGLRVFGCGMSRIRPGFLESSPSTHFTASVDPPFVPSDNVTR